MNFLFNTYIFIYYILTFVVISHQLHKKHHRLKAMTKQSRDSRYPKIKLSNRIAYNKELHSKISNFTKNTSEIKNKITGQKKVASHKSRNRILKKHFIPYSEDLHYNLKGDSNLRNRKKNFVNHENSIIEKKNHLKLFHKILQSFGRSLRRSKLSRILNTHVLKKHLIPLSTENDILLSKDDIYTSKYPFIKSELKAEPNQLTILKHAALDDIVNTAVNKVVSQIESRKTNNKIQDARILSGYKRNKNNTLYTSNNSKSSDTQIMSDLLENNSEDEKLSDSKTDDNENVLVLPSLNADQNKRYPNKNVMYKLQLTDDNESEKNEENTSKSNNSLNIEEQKKIHIKQIQVINQLTDNQSKPSIIGQSNSLPNNQSNGSFSSTLVNSIIQKNTSENQSNSSTSKGFYLDPFENIDSENTTSSEDNLTKSVLEKNLLRDSDSTAINEERMGYDIRDFYTNREEEDTDYRDKIARRKHQRINNLAAVKKDSLISTGSVKKDTLENSNDRVEINDIIKTFYDGGFNFLEPDSKFMHISENEDSFRTKESDDDSHTENEYNKIENDSETDHPELADVKTLENITKNETELSNLVSLTKDNNYKNQGIKLLEHKDVIETDDNSFDEINIDEQNLHLEAKIDSIAAREKVLKDLTDVIKVLRNLQPIHDGNDIERTKSTNEGEPYEEGASPAFTESVLDLQSDKPSPSSYTVTLNGNVYKLEKLSKDSQFAPTLKDPQISSAEGKDSQILPKHGKDFALQRGEKDSRFTHTGRKNSKLSSAEREKDSPLISYGGKDSLTTAVESSAPLLPQGGTQPLTSKEANGSTSPTTLVLNIQTGNPNANYNFERVYSDHDAKQTFQQGETYSPEVMLDSSEVTKANNPPANLPNENPQNKIQNISDGIYQNTTANENMQNDGIAKKPDSIKENKHPSYILHNLHHKTFKIQQIDDINEINSKSESFDPVSNQDIFEIRHNDKLFKIIEIKDAPKPCQEDIKKPCTAIHDDDVKHIIAARPDGNILSGKNFTGKTIHVTYKNPSKDIDIVREAVTKEVTKDLSNKNMRVENMKIFSPSTIYSNASVENDGEDLVNETTIDNKNIIFKDDELTKITEDDQLNKMSFVKPETQSDSSGEFRDRVPDENYDTFIFQIPRSNNTDIKRLNKENKNKETETDERTSRENKSRNEGNRINTSNNLEETLNQQIVP